MTSFSLVILIISASVHVVAHVYLKRAADRDAAAWWMLFWSGLTFSPALLLLFREGISPMGWGIISLSALFEALYFASITRAYQTGDLSIVYPLARGTAPVFLLVWSAWLLREHPTAGGAAGVLVIAGGLYAINLPKLGAWLEPLKALNHSGARWALWAGLWISIYTMLDSVGSKLITPLLYNDLVIWLTWLALTPGTLRAVGWNGLKAHWRLSKAGSVIAGFTTMTAYTMVLYTMQIGTPATYAGAVREISVVLGVVVGVVLLKEKGTAMRFLGAACVTAGIVLIKLLG